MGTVASQITSLTTVYSTVWSDADKKKTSKLRVIELCAGNSPVTDEFPAQMSSNEENVSIWWRHHVGYDHLAIVTVIYSTTMIYLISRMHRNCHYCD